MGVFQPNQDYFRRMGKIYRELHAAAEKERADNQDKRDDRLAEKIGAQTRESQNPIEGSKHMSDLILLEQRLAALEENPHPMVEAIKQASYAEATASQPSPSYRRA